MYTGPYQKVTGTTSRVISECDISGLEIGHLVALRGVTNNLLIGRCITIMEEEISCHGLMAHIQPFGSPQR